MAAAVCPESLRRPAVPLGTSWPRWGDVDWERNRITVHSPKTEHHEGRESRQIPIFPELRPYLEEVWEQPSRGRSTLSRGIGPATPTCGRSWSGSSGGPGWSRGPSRFRIFDRPGKPNWRSSSPSMLSALGSATPRRWPPSTTFRSAMRTSSGLRSATQNPTHFRREIRRSNGRAILEHPGKKRRKPLKTKGLCQNILGCARITQKS